MKRNQKNLYALLLLFPLLTASLSCKKDKKNEETAYTCTTRVAAPEAKTENNIISTGTYKGSDNRRTWIAKRTL